MEESLKANLYSESFLSFDKKYPQIVTELKKINKTMLLDGKITVEGKDILYAISDILYCEGRDLRDLPFKKRREILAGAFSDGKLVRKVKPVEKFKNETHYIANKESQFRNASPRSIPTMMVSSVSLRQ